MSNFLIRNNISTEFESKCQKLWQIYHLGSKSVKSSIQIIVRRKLGKC